MDNPQKQAWGWVVIDKDIMMGSMHVTHRVRKALGLKKAGHAGTLDPLATGVLPIALGQTTALIPFALACRKTYLFTVAWGSETTTHDRLGQVVHAGGSVPDARAVNNILDQFQGNITQVPPAYCAAKIQGMPAYTLARRGQPVALEPRPVTIHKMVMCSAEQAHNWYRDPGEQQWAGHSNMTHFVVVCASGTYVRSLARDMAYALGTYGHVVALRRLRVGPFCVRGWHRHDHAIHGLTGAGEDNQWDTHDGVEHSESCAEDAVTSQGISSMAWVLSDWYARIGLLTGGQGTGEEWMVPRDAVIRHLPHVVLPAAQCQAVHNGMAVSAPAGWQHPCLPQQNDSKTCSPRTDFSHGCQHDHVVGHDQVSVRILAPESRKENHKPLEGVKGMAIWQVPMCVRKDHQPASMIHRRILTDEWRSQKRGGNLLSVQPDGQKMQKSKGSQWTFLVSDRQQVQAHQRDAVNRGQKCFHQNHQVTQDNRWHVWQDHRSDGVTWALWDPLRTCQEDRVLNALCAVGKKCPSNISNLSYLVGKAQIKHLFCQGKGYAVGDGLVWLAQERYVVNSNGYCDWTREQMSCEDKKNVHPVCEDPGQDVHQQAGKGLDALDITARASPLHKDLVVCYDECGRLVALARYRNMALAPVRCFTDFYKEHL